MTNFAPIITAVLADADPKTSVDFSKHPEDCDVFIRRAQLIVGYVEAGLPQPLSQERLQSLARKFASHERRYRLESEMRSLDDMAYDVQDAIIQRPAWLDDDALTLKQIIMQHRVCATQKAAALEITVRQNAALSLPPQIILTSTLIPNYKLVELITPQHLQAESAALGHCLGTKYNQEALIFKGLSEGDEGAERYLKYILDIRYGRSRIFSLRDEDDQPCATLAYAVKQRTITEMEGAGQPSDSNDHRITGQEPFFPALCDILHQLPSVLPLENNGLRKTFSLERIDTIIDRYGKITCYYENQDPNDLISASMVLSNLMSAKTIAGLTNNKFLELEIHREFTQLELLPDTITADFSIITLSKSSENTIANLVSVNNLSLDATNAKIIFSELKRCAKILTRNGTVIAPKLEVARAIYANEIYAPLLDRSKVTVPANVIWLDTPPMTPKLPTEQTISSKDRKHPNP